MYAPYFQVSRNMYMKISMSLMIFVCANLDFLDISNAGVACGMHAYMYIKNKIRNTINKAVISKSS